MYSLPTNYSNLSDSVTLESNQTHRSFIAEFEPIVLLTLSSANFVHSAFSAYLFAHQCKEVARILRRLLIALTTCESCFHLCLITIYLLVMTMQPPPSYLIVILGVLIRFSLCMRNWSIAIISWSRVEAVVRPMSSRRGTFFTGFKITAAFIILSVFSAVLSAFKQMTHDPELEKYFPINYKLVVDKVFYTYQCMVPVLLVIIATFITVIFLRKQADIRRRFSQSEPGIIRKKDKDGATRRSYGSAERRERQAMQIIIGLSVTFFLLECPTVITGFLPEVRDREDVKLAVNILLELDSMGNFVIYTCTTKVFRSFWTTRVCGRVCGTSDRHLNSNSCTTANNSMTLPNNYKSTHNGHSHGHGRAHSVHAKSGQAQFVCVEESHLRVPETVTNNGTDADTDMSDKEDGRCSSYMTTLL